MFSHLGNKLTRAVIFSGHGMAKGVNYTDSGERLIIPRGFSGVIDSKGQGAIKKPVWLPTFVALN